jgi:hypothetical protein
MSQTSSQTAKRILVADRESSELWSMAQLGRLISTKVSLTSLLIVNTIIHSC